MKLYDVVKQMLEEYPQLRDSDRKLIWNLWHKKGILEGEGKKTTISFENFMTAPHPESIRRVRQKIQEQHPHLKATLEVDEIKREIEAWGGNHVFQENL